MLCEVFAVCWGVLARVTKNLCTMYKIQHWFLMADDDADSCVGDVRERRRWECLHNPPLA